MGAKFKFIDDARKFGKMLEGFIQLADEVESVAALEQQASEIEARVAALKIEESKAKASTESAKSDLYAVQINAESIEKSAKERAESIIEEARNKAASLVDESFNQIEKKSAELDSKSEAIKLDIENLSLRKFDLEKEIQEKQSKLEELDKKLASIKASLGV